MSNAAEQDPLGYSLFALGGLIKKWFNEDARPSDLLSDEYKGFVRATQVHSHRVTFFGDEQGIDMTPLLRFLRAVEGRCEWSEVDEQAVHDATESVLLRHLLLTRKPREQETTTESLPPTKDGPTNDFRFAYKGRFHFIGKNRNWDLLTCLWEYGTTPVPFSEIGENVWGNDLTSPSTIRPQVTRLNNLFAGFGIPISWTTSGEHAVRSS